jgi:hypothetical protein
MAKFTKNKFIEQARKAHGDKYEYPGDYTNCDTKTEIVCRDHGSFLQTPYQHIRTQNGCPECRLFELKYLALNLTGGGGKPSTKEAFIKKARQVHGDKYEYIGEYKNCKVHIEIKCPYHGIFLQTPDNLITC